MITPALPSYAGHQFPAEIISHAVWMYFRFPLSLRMVKEMLAARGIVVSHETVRQWALKFGQAFANSISWSPCNAPWGSCGGAPHWPCRASIIQMGRGNRFCCKVYY
jgi:hypothetical protein